MEEAQQYVSPFSSRYASSEMSYLFSSHYRTLTFRKLWVALAKGQKKLGLSITERQIASLKKNLEKIDLEKIAYLEKKFRHDVMAHIHAFGDLSTEAKPILHLGATSTFVTDNGDLIQMKQALELLFSKLRHVIEKLSDFAKKHAKDPCLGFTHFQPAQPVTTGKRACLWLQDFLFDAQEWKRLLETIPFLGVKGATGTQSSFLHLFEGNEKKVKELETFVAKTFGFKKVLPISGQTYTRKIDLHIANALASFAASAHKMATDLRLLSHTGEMAESFTKTQVGSSAMPYKKNPIHSERICGIARFVMSLSQNPSYTLATQWLERSLDDSSNKRLAIPELFLGTDALLNLLIHLLSTFSADKKMAREKMDAYLPFLVQENILMACANKGKDRQIFHEKLRNLSLQAKLQENPYSFIVKAISEDPEFGLKETEIQDLCSIQSLTGRASSQVKEFLQQEVKPFLSKSKKRQVPTSPIEI